jgi:dihydrolipoamide dehydrogenase
MERGLVDLIVIGAGPGGYEAAAQAGRLGKKTVLVEKEYIGGACLNVGCIPAKTFLRSSKLFADCLNGSVYGVETESVRFNLREVVQRKERLVEMLTRGVEGLLLRSGVEVVRGEARLTSRDSVQVGETVYRGKNILIASGSRPAIPPIPGIESESVVDSTGVLSLSELPGDVALIGGGYIGLEFAGFFAEVGCRVTVLEMLTQIAAGCDHDISGRLEQSLKKKGINIQTACRVHSIEGNKVHYLDSEGRRSSIRADLIVNATGRVPVLDGLGLKEVGIDFDRGGIKTSDQGKTNIPGIWACGDVTGRRMLAHAATREGQVAVNNMFGKSDRIRYSAVPAIIYTHPEVAVVGKTESELKAAGIDYSKALVPMSLSGRFLVENEGSPGIVKLMAGKKYGEILGVHCLGDFSSEFIVAAAEMIELELCVQDLEEIVFPHPTVSEVLKQAAMACISQGNS